MELSDDENDGGRDLRNSGDEGGNRSDEAAEEGGGQGRRIDPATSKKRVSRNPQPKLNAERIQGPKGVQTIEKYFEGFKFHGKGHEKADLDRVMKRLEHWAHRLFPKYQFGDFLEKMETLGSKKNVQVFLKKYRLDMIRPDDDVVDPDDANDAIEEAEDIQEVQPVDAFDRLLDEQIEKQSHVTNETPRAANKPSGNVLGSASTAKPSELTDEVKARIEANRKLAIERKMARLRREEENKKKQLEASQVDSEPTNSTEVRNTNKSSNNTEETRNGISSPEITAAKAVSVTVEEEAEDIVQDKVNNTVEEEIKEPDAHDLSEETVSVAEVGEEPQTTYEHIDDDSQQSLLSAGYARGDEVAPELFEESVYHFEGYNSYKTNEHRTESNKESDNLLTHDQLLMEIDGAMEEIINKSTRRST